MERECPKCGKILLKKPLGRQIKDCFGSSFTSSSEHCYVCLNCGYKGNIKTIKCKYKWYD